MKFTSITLGAVAAFSACALASQHHNNIHHIHVKKIMQVQKRAFGDVKQETWGKGAFGGVVEEQPWPEADAEPTPTLTVLKWHSTPTKKASSSPKLTTSKADKEKEEKAKKEKEEKERKEKEEKEKEEEEEEKRERKPIENNIEKEEEIETVSIESTTTLTETVVVTVTSTRSAVATP